MQESRLFLALSALDSSSLRSFTDFVHSPFFNKKERVANFFLLLKKVLQKGAPYRLDKELIYKQVFKQSEYCGQTFNSLQNQLYKVLEKFLAYQQMQKDGAAEELYLLESVIDLKLNKSYQHSYTKVEKKLANQTKESSQLFAQQNKLADLYDAEFQAKKKRSMNYQLENAALLFDEYLLIKKLHYLCNMLTNEKFIAFTHSKTLLPEIKAMLKQQETPPPIIQTYYLLLLTQSEEEQRHIYFAQLKEAIIKYQDQIHQNDMRNIIQMAINHCSVQIRVHRDTNYVKEAMELYQIGVSSKILLINDIISPWTYKNIVELGIGLQQYQWVEDFINTYHKKLPLAMQQDAYHFSLANLFYVKNNYDIAQQHLHTLEFKDTHYYLGAKVLLLKIYYEEDSFDALDSLLFSVKIYLKRNKTLSPQAKKPYENFVRFVHQLVKYGNTKTTALKTEIENTSMCTNKRWLFKQIDILQQNSYI